MSVSEAPALLDTFTSPLAKLRALSGFPTAVAIKDRDGWHVVASVVDHPELGDWSDFYVCWLTRMPSPTEDGAIDHALSLLETS